MDVLGCDSRAYSHGPRSTGKEAVVVVEVVDGEDILKQASGPGSGICWALSAVRLG